MSVTNTITCIIKLIHIVQLVYQYHPFAGTQIREGQKLGLVYHIQKASAWWRHEIETLSALLDLCAGNSPVTGEFAAQRLVSRSFDIYFDLRLK